MPGHTRAAPFSLDWCLVPGAGGAAWGRGCRRRGGGRAARTESPAGSHVSAGPEPGLSFPLQQDPVLLECREGTGHTAVQEQGTGGPRWVSQDKAPTLRSLSLGGASLPPGKTTQVPWSTDVGSLCGGWGVVQGRGTTEGKTEGGEGAPEGANHKAAPAGPRSALGTPGPKNLCRQQLRPLGTGETHSAPGQWEALRTEAGQAHCRLPGPRGPLTCPTGNGLCSEPASDSKWGPWPAAAPGGPIQRRRTGTGVSSAHGAEHGQTGSACRSHPSPSPAPPDPPNH